MQQLNEAIQKIKQEMASINEDFVADKCDLDQMMDRTVEKRDLRVQEVNQQKMELEAISQQEDQYLEKDRTKI